MAIISGMNMSPVSRLKKTWSKVKTAKFDILEHQMDPSSNFYNYRTALRGATQRSITANSSREKVRHQQKHFWDKHLGLDQSVEGLCQKVVSLILTHAATSDMKV
ncbi:Ras-GEF domain-containing member 1B-A [Xenotaenia resolanae]|uniref:Ras-GEF domain-containing member 1B-A n=1 Tax=Xenotaenia resolanae TaxID=208358 RepID=A0ABV0VVQ1_9TELE